MRRSPPIQVGGVGKHLRPAVVRVLDVSQHPLAPMGTCVKGTDYALAFRLSAVSARRFRERSRAGHFRAASLPFLSFLSASL